MDKLGESGSDESKTDLTDATQFTSIKEGIDEKLERWRPPSTLECSTSVVPKLPSILDGELFVVTENRGGQILARCQVCVAPKIVRGSRYSTGNFISHIKRMHPEKRKVIEAKRIFSRDHSRRLFATLSTSPGNADHSGINSTDETSFDQQTTDQNHFEAGTPATSSKKPGSSSPIMEAGQPSSKGSDPAAAERKKALGSFNENSDGVFGRYVGLEVSNMARAGFEDVADELKLQIHASINKAKQEIRDKNQCQSFL